MTFKPVQILFFVDGVAPTAEDLVAASALNAHVMFRNARAVPAEGSLETCDGVAGKVPPRYASAYPTAEKAIESRAAKIAALAVKVGDTPAPVVPVKSVEADAKAAEPAADAQQGAGAGDAADAKAPGGKAASKAWNAN